MNLIESLCFQGIRWQWEKKEKKPPPTIKCWRGSVNLVEKETTKLPNDANQTWQSLVIVE